MSLLWPLLLLVLCFLRTLVRRKTTNIQSLSTQTETETQNPRINYVLGNGVLHPGSGDQGEGEKPFHRFFFGFFFLQCVFVGSTKYAGGVILNCKMGDE